MISSSINWSLAASLCGVCNPIPNTNRQLPASTSLPRVRVNSNFNNFDAYKAICEKIRGKVKKTKSWAACQHRRKHLFSVKFPFNNNTPSTFFFTFHPSLSIALTIFFEFFFSFYRRQTGNNRSWNCWLNFIGTTKTDTKMIDWRMPGWLPI